MKKASVASVKNNLSRYLAYVRRGGRVVICNRDLPVAELIPVRANQPDAGEEDTRLGRLERDGIVRRGSHPLPDDLLDAPRGRPVRVLDALLQERAGGR